MIEKRVLFVEDSATMRRIIMNSLQKIGFEDIIEAEDGADALSKIGDKDIGLVITDWNMPNMSGKELVENLRANPRYKDTPIVMITTRGMKEDVQTAIQLGLNGYIVKPFTPKVLQRKLEQILK